jgi:hypothetical protein
MRLVAPASQDLRSGRFSNAFGGRSIVPRAQRVVSPPYDPAP